MHCKSLFLFLLIYFPLVILSSCNNEIHKEGKLLYYTSLENGLFVVYQKNDENYLLALDLAPLDDKWEKKISGHPTEPVIGIFENYIICNCKKGKVCVLSRDNGDIIADIESSLVISKNYKGLIISGNVLYSICGSNSICATNIDKNEKVWEYKLSPNEKITADFKIEGNLFFYGNNNNEITAINLSKGVKSWKSDPLNGLVDIYAFPETVLADYDNVNGFSPLNGENKWLAPYSGKVRCVMDGFVITQNDDFFSTLFIENGLENWKYPRTGTTFLTCEESLSMIAFTVKNYSENENTDIENTDYFDKVYIFDATTGERVFDFNSEKNLKVINLTGFLSDRFYIAMENIDSGKEITIQKYLTKDWKKDVSYTFGIDIPGSDIYVSWMHSDATYTIFRRSNISDEEDNVYFLFYTETGELLGRMENYPEVITGKKVYDIISYDNYFNIVEKTLSDFLIYD